jgi:PAS domain S-box-containing protein
LTDSEGKILTVNEALTDLLGCQQNDVVGMHINSLFKQSSDDIGIPAEISRGQTFKAQEIRIKTKPEIEKHALLSNSVMKNKTGRIVGLVYVLQDITERKSLEDKLLKAERFASIGELSAMVSHDLRSPLAGIANAVYYLKTKGQSKMSEKEKEMLTLIERSVDHSNRIIGDLLDYSREIKLDRNQTDPRSLLEEALVQLEVPNGITIVKKVESEPKISVDKDKIIRVFTNLIRNAIDAMPSGGMLTVVSQKTESHTIINFADTGMGISEENLQKLWTPLFTTKAKGMGLGLSICKRFVEAHGGEILVKSQVGKGTSFTVRIPIEHGYEQNKAVIVNLQPKTEIDVKASQ